MTVIIPAFRAEVTLERTIHSVLSQTERSLEVIIVDDDSPDGTVSVARRAADQDARVQVIEFKCNGGKPAAMNEATRHARGTWIAVVDADDWYAPTRLQRLIDAAEYAGVDMVADNQVIVDAETGHQTVHDFLPRSSETFGIDGFLAGSNPLRSFDLGMLKPIFRANFIREHGIEYYTQARNGHDFYVLLCFFQAGGLALLLKEPLYYYVRVGRVLWSKRVKLPGKKYRYDLILSTNNHYLTAFGPDMTEWQRRKLADRGRVLAAMVRLHHLRDRLRAKDVIGVTKIVRELPAETWTILAKRLIER